MSLVLRVFTKGRALPGVEEEVSVVITSLRQAYPSVHRPGQEYEGNTYTHAQIFKHYESNYLNCLEYVPSSYLASYLHNGLEGQLKFKILFSLFCLLAKTIVLFSPCWFCPI